MHKFLYNGKSSEDFGLILSGEDTWGRSMPDVERMQIPGRNGDLLLSNKRYDNVTITYHVGIRSNFRVNYTAFMNFLLNHPGYHRLRRKHIRGVRIAYRRWPVRFSDSGAACIRRRRPLRMFARIPRRLCQTRSRSRRVRRGGPLRLAISG